MHPQTKFPIQQFGSSPIESLSLVVRTMLSARDLKAVRLVFEQGAVRVDQLARFLALPTGRMAVVLRRLEEFHLLSHAEVVSGTPVWVMPTGVGVYVVSPKLGKRQFGTKPPTPRFVPHYIAMNEIRLRYELDYPQAEWISERLLYVKGFDGHRPDAVVEINGERRAIEAEMSPKKTSQTAQIVSQLFEHYDAVHYYCTPVVRRVLQRVQDMKQWPNLYVHDLPDR